MPVEEILEKGERYRIFLADPEPIPRVRHFVGRESELRRCRAAWGIDPTTDRLSNQQARLHFRLQGAPGVGKNEIVYELARLLAKSENIPFYMIQGHEELTPEDLALLLVPDPGAGHGGQGVPLVLRASPLATAVYQGGLFFFDEINRVPERALAPLAAVLDSRQYMYSAITGIHIKPKNEEARKRFRFCCALNPEVSVSGRGVLPDYIEQRTLPAIEVRNPTPEVMREIIQRNLDLAPGHTLLKEFDRWYKERAKQEISVRQALSLMMLALNFGGEPGQAIDEASQGIQLSNGRPEEV